MPSTNSTLPEGTDTILPDASDILVEGGSANETGTRGGKIRSALGDLEEKLGDKTAGIRGQAADKARDYALQGKDRTVGALDGVAKLVSDSALIIDDKVGQQFGDYARKAADSIGGLAETLRNKDVDDLFNDARDAVRKSPAIAIGAAAAVGFILARAIKASATPADETPDRSSSASKTRSTASKASAG